MKTVTLGTQGLQVPAIGLGCMGMSDFYGTSDEQKNLTLLNQAMELGCNFWDSSDIYGPYTNESRGQGIKGSGLTFNIPEN